MKRFNLLFCSSLMLLSSGAALAQTVFRCGSNYSQTPCANGRPIQADDPRSPEQRNLAQQALVRDKALLREQEDSHHRDEAMALAQAKMLQAAQARHAAERTISEAKQRASNTSGKTGKSNKKGAGKRTARIEEPGVFTASAPNPTATKKAKTKAKAR